MKARLLKFTSLITITALMLTSLTSLVFAAQSGENETGHITQITVKATEIKAKGAFKAIQSALNSARYSATKDNVYRVAVEPGSYELRSSLHIYSNTTLALTNVTLTRNSEAVANMIRVGDDTACNEGGTGYEANTNITVEGGTLNGGGTSNTMVKVTHTSNFLMVGTELLNIRNAHIMEVAAVDGLYIRNCSFKDHLLDADEVGYEAIQLDIPKNGHIVGCRSEALSVRDVRVEGCYFSNCPRAIGSHTQILNLPHENIVITDNTFTDIKSAAIQGENWKNVKITNNRIEKTPRGISVYSVLGNGAGGFRASVLAKEGATQTAVSDAYQKPYCANILISNNTITDCGTVKDVYAGYDPLAISVVGNNLKSKTKSFTDGAGGYPAGNYYITGVTISNNVINSAGHGIYLNDVRNIRVDSNTISCSKSSITDQATNPLTSIDTVFASVSGNTIDASPYHGMELAASTMSKISGNNISGTAQDGILLEAQSKVTDGITDNFITGASRYGINIRPNCAAGSISGNVIYGCSKGAIQQEKKASASIGDNYYKVAEMTSLTLNQETIGMGEEEQYTLVPSYAPANAVAKFSWSSADPLVASVNDSGVVTAHGFGETDITVTAAGSNKSAFCHVKVMPAPKSIKLNANMLTIGLGETYDLDSKLSEGTIARSVTYVSNNPGAVSVKASGGLLTGTGIGTATVVAKTYNGKHACCNVIVKSAPYDIWFDHGELDMGVGEISTLQLILPEGSASHSIVWASSDDKVVSVGQGGEIVAKTKGEATVTATAFNGVVAVCNISVKDEPTEVSFSQSEYVVTAGETGQLEVVLPEGTASNALSFQSSDPDVCRINKTTGEVTAKKEGTVTITVKTYNRVSATCFVKVESAEEPEWE